MLDLTMDSIDIWVVGAGAMATDYVKVLTALDVDVTVVGRGEESAQKMSVDCGLSVITGGLTSFLETKPKLPSAVIVAVGVENLASTAKQLLEFGVKRVLLEKPGALKYSELTSLNELAKIREAEVIIAYNRRMYASVLAAKKIIDDDGGAQSMVFEFTEWGHVIESLEKAKGVKEAWLLGNSTHVIDLAFHLAGSPIELQSFTRGSLDWHPSSAIFVGSGRTDKDVLFSYQANWDAPGRWGLEVLTRHRRLIFRPMESLQVMNRGSVAIDTVEIDDASDKAFKPGLFRQVQKFLAQDKMAGLCTLEEQVCRWPIYEKIAGYIPS